MSITIYHNPRCSKSRKTLEILQENSVDFSVVEYLKTAPSGDQIQALASRLDMTVADLIRRNEAEFKEANDLPALDDDAALADWISANPKVLQRPIVDNGKGKARIGRPPESVLEIIDV